jgi:hypothetical protein
VKYKPTTTKNSWLAPTAASSKDRWIGAYSIGLTIPGKVGCPNNNKKNKKKYNISKMFCPPATVYKVASHYRFE